MERLWNSIVYPSGNCGRCYWTSYLARMIQSSFTIDLYLACVAHKVFTWDEVKQFAANSRKFNTASDEEVYEVFTELRKNYGFKIQQ